MEFFKEYKNGLRLIVKKIEGLLSVTCGVIVGTGSANEPAGFNGISHYIEHMMFKGTDKRTAFEISDSFDRIGAQVNAFTTKEMTCYYTKCTTEHFSEALEVLSDLFFNSKFNEEEQKREKGVISEEIAMSEDTPDDLVIDLLSEKFFGKRGYGQTILGPVKNVEKFGKQDIDAFMSGCYTPSNTVISIAGNIDFDKADRLISELFADEFKFSGKKTCKNGFSGYKTGSISKYKDIEQAHIAIALPGCELDSVDSNILTLANTVLGGGMSSRLFQSVRERKGLAYSVYSYLSAYKTCGMMNIYAGVNPSNTALALETVAKLIKEYKKEGIDGEEFLRGREQIKGSFIMGQESTSSQMLLYGRYLLFTGKVFSFDKKIAEINSMTREKVNECIERYYLLENAAFAYVGKEGKTIDVKSLI